MMNSRTGNMRLPFPAYAIKNAKYEILYIFCIFAQIIDLDIVLKSESDDNIGIQRSCSSHHVFRIFANKRHFPVAGRIMPPHAVVVPVIVDG